MSQGVDPNIVHEQPPHWRPLEAAMEEVVFYDGSLEIVRLLLKHSADVNVRDGKHGDTPLHTAMGCNNKEAIRLLLEAGADPNAVSDQGEGPLRWAVERNDLEKAKLFLTFGAEKTINAFGGFCGDTALGLAARNLNVPMVELLLSAGADPEALDEDKKTARERLPARDESDPQVWGRAIEMLSSRP